MRTRACAVAALSLAVGCSGSGGRATSAASVISDEEHGGGTAGFVFLPPLVKSASSAGTFDPGAAVTVRIDELATGTAIAVFTMTSGPGSETIRAEPDCYVVNWHTADSALSVEKTYRIRVLVAGRELGFADVDVAATGRELRNVNTDEFVPLLEDGTLPIKFFVSTAVTRTDYSGLCSGIDPKPGGACSRTFTACAYDAECPEYMFGLPEGERCRWMRASTRWVDNGDGTVTDWQTCLTWEKKTGTTATAIECHVEETCPDPHDVNNLYSWSTGSPWLLDGTAATVFLARLNGSSFAGHDDWRLPTSWFAESVDANPELESILFAPGFDCGRSPCRQIDTAAEGDLILPPLQFLAALGESYVGPDQLGGAYWSSSGMNQVMPAERRGWNADQVAIAVYGGPRYFPFPQGATWPPTWLGAEKSSFGLVRAVRGGVRTRWCEVQLSPTICPRILGQP